MSKIYNYLNEYRKIFKRIIINIKRPSESWLSHVPAAAVIRERQALFVINGSKGYVGGIVNLFLNDT